jgi:hypothetical protein
VVKKILREEMEILNGNDGNEIENETDDTKRSMKLILKSDLLILHLFVWFYVHKNE